MSKNWRHISKDIQLGIAQELLIKILSRYPEYKSIAPRSTINIDLYHNFLRSVHVAVPKTEEDPLLKSYFNKLNDAHFFGAMDPPNLRWGQESYRKLGSYDFGTDTITISQALHPDRTNDSEILEYVLYHEMLHKKHKFSSSGRRTRSHTSAFRADEAGFPNSRSCEARLKRLRPMRLLSSKSTKRDPSHPFERLVSLIWD